MSQVLSGIWAGDKPTCIWEGLPDVFDREANEWPDLITDRLTIVDRIGWKAIESEIVPRRAIVVYEQLALDFDLDQRFRQLEDQWRAETRYLSSLSRISMHPAYQRIIGLGRNAVPLILRELQERGGHWLWALHVLNDENPVPTDATFREAVRAWLDWGREQHYLT